MGKLADKFNNGLFTSNSPIERGEEEETAAPTILDSQVEEIMKARENLNKVHSEGYFENFYPQADKGLKEVLHNQAVRSVKTLESKAMGREGVGNIIINITLPK